MLPGIRALRHCHLLKWTLLRRWNNTPGKNKKALTNGDNTHSAPKATELPKELIKNSNKTKAEIQQLPQHKLLKPTTQHINAQVNERIIKDTFDRSVGRKSSISGSEEFSATRQQIFRSNSAKQIKNILKAGTNFDNSVYGAAIQKCGQLQDIDACISIMQMLSKRHIIPDSTIFGTLFQAFRINQRTDYIDEYIAQMIDYYNVKPNIHIATTLLTCFTKTGNVDKAEQIWDQIIVKYNLRPDIRTYQTMIQIHGQNGNSEKAEQFYVEMKHNGIEPDLMLQTTMIRAYIKCDQIDKAFNIKITMERNGQQLDAQCYTAFIGVYLKDSHLQPHKTLQLIEECECKCVMRQSKDIDVIMDLKFAAYMKVFEIEYDKKKKDMLFQTLTEILPQERMSKGLNQWNNKIAAMILRVYALHYENDFTNIKVIKCFELFCELKLLGYWYYCKNVSRWMIDLHGFGYDEISFIIHYLLNRKLKELVDTMGHDWIIICGKRLGTVPTSKDLQIGIKQFIIEQLKSYNISCQTNSTNKGRLSLNIKDVRNHVKLRNIF
eukprot:130691_1